MKEGYWVVRTYEAGAVGEKTKFWVPGKRPEGKARKKEKSEIRKQEQNEYSARKALARILNANFTSEDYFLGLDYSKTGMEKLEKWLITKGVSLDELEETERLNALWEAADHELYNCLRRVNNRLKKEGLQVKAAYITSDMDGDTGETVRVHHHLVINREARDAFVDAWKKEGGVSWSTLWEYQDDRTPVAEYMLAQVRHVPDAKKYRTTRNLIRPEPKDRIVLSDAELRVPKGAKLLFRQEFKKPGQPQYIRYVLPRKSKPGGGEDPDDPGDDAI